MLGSLRVRLPLVFLAGIVLAGVITTAISIRLFQQFTENQTLSKLNREANGIAELYSKAVNAGYGNKNLDQKAPTFAGKTLEKATGDRIYLARSAPRSLPRPDHRAASVAAGADRLAHREVGHVRVHAAGAAPPVSGGRQPDRIVRRPTIGAIVVATPKTDIRQQVDALIGRLAIAGAFGLLVAALLAWYLSRRIVRPILQLSDAVDEVASGNYDVEVPPNAPGELGHLSSRVGEMAHRLGLVEQMERNFLMSVSHELRTPLTAIRGHVAALLEGVIEDPELRHSSLETVEAETQRLERLVGDILDLAKLDTNRFTVTTEEVDMAALIEQAYERYRDEAQRRSIDYRQQLDARPVITSDGDRVLQVVGNLLSNAFRATPDGGRITLELAQRNGTVHVAVEDTGPGIPAEARERLFRPFVSNVSGGTGLGLAIAKELSTALGGRIDLESEVGEGSRFELLLPASA